LIRFGCLFMLLMFFFPTVSLAGEWEYDISGHAQGLYGYSSPKEHNHGIGQANFDSSASYNFDNGESIEFHLDFMFGINQEIQSYNQGRWGEETYAVYDSEYGQIILGQTHNVAYLFHNGIPLVGAFASNNDIVDFIANPNWRRSSKETLFTTLNTTELNTDGVAPKINYISPEFYGTAIGFSYMPDSYNRRGLINKHADYAHDDGFVGAIYNDYDWGYFLSQSSFGYAQYHGNDKELSFSVRLSRGNWSFGGGYRKTYIDGDDKSISASGLLPEFDGYREGQAWNIGIGYEIGPFSTALSYFSSKSDYSDNQNKIVAFSNQYQLSKNIDIYLAAAYADFESGKIDTDGYTLVTGLGVNF